MSLSLSFYADGKGGGRLFGASLAHIEHRTACTLMTGSKSSPSVAQSGDCGKPADGSGAFGQSPSPESLRLSQPRYSLSACRRMRKRPTCHAGKSNVPNPAARSRRRPNQPAAGGAVFGGDQRHELVRRATRPDDSRSHLLSGRCVRSGFRSWFSRPAWGVRATTVPISGVVGRAADTWRSSCSIPAATRRLAAGCGRGRNCSGRSTTRTTFATGRWT